MKHILITGGTGFIGKELRRILLQEGYNLIIVTRNPKKYDDEKAKNQKFISWNDDLTEAMNSTDVVIHLAGENVFSQRWSDEVKKVIYDSRIDSTRKLVDAMRNADSQPEVFISASGSGFYGNGGDSIKTESDQVGDDFLAEVCKDWEAESQKATEFGVRVANPRIGIVLEKDGGAMEKMIPPFQLFVGGPVGDGKQFMSWVHRDDMVQALIFPVENEIQGPYNVCAPIPVTMNTFAAVLGEVMHRPSFFRVPKIALEIMYGEGAKPILDSIRMKPAILQEKGFEFEYDDLEEALADILD
jgi:uncharacterized protein (TIGR01777 family)